MEEALVLSRLCSSVAVIHRRGQFRASKVMQERLLADPKITVFYNRKVVKFQGDGVRLQHLELQDTSTSSGSLLGVDAAFVAIGRDPNAGFLANSVRRDSQGYLQVDAGSTRTSVNGIFAAGDVADHTYRQAITSAASGAMAAMDVDKYFSGATEAWEESSLGLCSFVKGVLGGSFQLGCIGAMLSSTRL
jgi:thioredoxin reductase (NADPH)